MYEKECDVVFSDGIYTELCQEFIKYKRGMGQKFVRDSQYDLLHLCSLLNEMEICTPVLTKETVEKVAARKPGESQATQANRICFLRQFATFMNIAEA
jgi:site-specific recombinase XerC